MNRFRIVTLAVCVLASSALAQQSTPTAGRALATPSVNKTLCTPVGTSHSLVFTPGATRTNTFVCTADPELRKFLIYVPSTYSAQHAPYPLVYMFHGTGQVAQNSVNNTTWNHAAEVGGFIAIYPEALPYLLLDGTTRTKWRTGAVEDFVVDPSELPMADDTQYVRELHNTVISSLNVDCARVYASGFSNGGGFVKQELRIDLADIFAATSSAGGIGVPVGTAADYFPANGEDFRPHFEIVGTRDDKKIANCVAAGDLMPGDILPRMVSVVIATPCMWDPMTLYAESAGMDPAVFSTVENASFTQFLWSSVVHPGPGPTEYRFRILPNLAHEYPSGTNYPTDYVPILWTWMRQYTR